VFRFTGAGPADREKVNEGLSTGAECIVLDNGQRDFHFREFSTATDDGTRVYARGGRRYVRTLWSIIFEGEPAFANHVKK
jgi:hypothetical protein